MNKSSVETLLKLLTVPPTGYRGPWVVSHCPYGRWRHSGGVDNHPSFGIKSSTKSRSIYKCMSCGMGGDLSDLIFDLGIQLKLDPHPAYKMSEAAVLVANEFSDLEMDFLTIPDFEDMGPGVKKDVVFPESWLASFKSVMSFPVAVAYLNGRGIPSKVIEELDLRYDPVQQRIGFPFRNAKGELVGLQGRDINKNSTLRYKQYSYKNQYNPLAWMGEDLLDLDQPVVVTEGPIDYCKIYMAYKNVACSFTSGLSVEKLHRISDATSLVTFYDYGGGGDNARAKIKKVFPHMPMEHIIPSELEDDAGNCHPVVIREYLEDYVTLLPKGYWS